MLDRIIVRGVQHADEAEVDFGALAEKLLLFDTFVLHSQHLFEIPPLVERFGIGPVKDMLDSGAVEVATDFVQFGAVPRRRTVRAEADRELCTLSAGPRQGVGAGHGAVTEIVRHPTQRRVAVFTNEHREGSGFNTERGR